MPKEKRMLNITNIFSNLNTNFANAYSQNKLHPMLTNIEYLDIVTEKNCRKFIMLTWTLIGQFVHPVGKVGGKGGGVSLFMPATSITFLSR